MPDELTPFTFLFYPYLTTLSLTTTSTKPQTLSLTTTSTHGEFQIPRNSRCDKACPRIEYLGGGRYGYGLGPLLSM